MLALAGAKATGIVVVALIALVAAAIKRTKGESSLEHGPRSSLHPFSIALLQHCSRSRQR